VNELTGATGSFMICPDGDEVGQYIPVVVDISGTVTSHRSSWQPACT